MYLKAKITALRNGNRFYRGRSDICEMLDNQQGSFTTIKLNGEKFICPVKPVRFYWNHSNDIHIFDINHRYTFRVRPVLIWFLELHNIKE